VEGRPVVQKGLLLSSQAPIAFKLTEDKLQSLIIVANVQYATVEMLDKRIFHKDAQPLLFEFLIIGSGSSAIENPKAGFPTCSDIAAVRIRIPASSVAPAASCAAFKRSAALFVTVSIVVYFLGAERRHHPASSGVCPCGSSS
jgi:hypothetical protein